MKYLPTPIDLYHGGKVAAVDLYINLSDRKFVRIVKKGQVFDDQRVENYVSHEITHLFITQSDYIEHASSQLELAEKIVQIAKIKKTESARKVICQSLARSVQTIALELYELEITPSAIERAKLICGYLANGLDSEYEPSIIFELVNSIPHNLVKQSVAVSMIASILGHALGWKNIENIKTLAFGGLVHDIGFRDLPPHLSSIPKEDMSIEEEMKYIQHPILGASILKKIPGIAEEVIQITQQHHELPNGTGFPNSLSKHQIIPMAQIIFLADQLCLLCTKSDKNPTPLTLMEAIRKVKIRYKELLPEMHWNALKKLKLASSY